MLEKPDAEGCHLEEREIISEYVSLQDHAVRA